MQQDEICQNRQLVLFVSVFMNKQRKQIDWHFGRIDNYLTAGYTEINRKTVQENGIRCKGIRTEAVRYLEWIIQEPHMTGDERQEEK